jgi:hypothetical protein
MSTKVKSLLRIVFVGAVSIIGLTLTPASGWAQGACASLGSEAAIKNKADELFKAWNDALKTGRQKDVVDRYATNSILLPTVSNEPRVTAAEKTDYFHHFQEKRPSGEISPVDRDVFCDRDTLTDAGLYTFTYDPAHLAPGQALYTRARYSFTYHFTNGQWLITSHHSSFMPETEVFCPVGIPSLYPYISDPKTYCPSNCSGTSAEWSWSVWNGKVMDINGMMRFCECFRTPKQPGYTGVCVRLPTKP